MITNIARRSNYCLVQRTTCLLLALMWGTRAFQTARTTFHQMQHHHRSISIPTETIPTTTTSSTLRRRQSSTSTSKSMSIPQLPSSPTSLRAFELTSPSVGILSSIDSFYQTAPYTAAFLTCGVKASAADLLAQTRSLNNNSDQEETQGQEQEGGESIQKSVNVNIDRLAITSQQEEEEDSIEVQRNVAFILYGGLYQGLAQEYLYNNLFPAWFGTGTDIMTVLTKVSFDLLVVSPLVCIPIAYLVKALIYKQNLSKGLEKYIYDLRYNNLLLTYYSIWFPAGLLSFGVIPDHLRIAFIAFVSFFWLVILSSVSSSSSEEVKQTQT